MGSLPLRFYFQVLLCALLWGSAFPVIKLSYFHLEIEGLGEQLLFSGTRFILAGLLVAVFCRRNVVATLRAAPKGKVLAITLGQTYFQYLFFYYALGVSSGALGALLVGAGSLWWVLLAPVFLKTALPNRNQWLILGSCTVGICIAVYAPGAGSGNVALGTAAFLLASFSGAVGALYMKQVSLTFGSRTMTSIALFGGGVMLLASGGYRWQAFWSHYNWVTFGVTFYLAALSATAFTIWNRLIERYSVNLLSTFRFLIPLCGVVESALFIEGETIGPGILVGGTIVILSLIAMSRVNGNLELDTSGSASAKSV